MARSLQEQLLDAYNESGMTFGDLRRLANLACSEDSVSRKLRGEQSLRSYEIEAMARALRVKVSTGRSKKAVA